MASSTMTFAGYQLRRILTDPMNLFFSMVLPALLYIFINAGDGGSEVNYDTGGNLSAYLMVGFALYGGVTAVVSGGALGVVNHLTGWGRQLALTPLTSSQILFAEVAQALLRIILPVTGVYIIGALTGATMPASAWVITFVACIVCAIPFTFLGMAAAAFNPTPNTVGIASASVAFLAFIGNIFIPLKDDWIALSRFTPLWGPGLLARHPVVGDTQIMPDSHATTSTDITYAIINIVVWAVILVSVYLVLSRRDKARL